MGKLMTSAAAMQAAGLLCLVSLHIIVEGTIRTVIDYDFQPRDGPHNTWPVGVSLTAAAVEILFGAAGLAVGGAGLLFSSGHPAATMVAMCMNVVLGWFTFIVFVFARPAYIADHLEHPDQVGNFPRLSEDEHNAMVTMGILGSFGYCAALQGAQFFFLFRLYHIQTEQAERYTVKFYRYRLGGYSLLQVVAGISQLAGGALIIDTFDDGKNTPPFVFPPYIIWYPALSVATGLFVLLAGFYGIVRAVTYTSEQGPEKRFFGLSPLGWACAFIWCFQMITMNIMAVGEMGSDGPPASAVPTNGTAFMGAMLAGLITILSFMPAYLDAAMRGITVCHVTSERYITKSAHA